MDLLNMPLYHYSDLDKDVETARVFVLRPTSPGQNPDHIEGAIIETDISDSTYEALSYEWGDSEAGRYIFIENSRLFVKENLWQALFHLRKGKERPLWIDAICIDQQNTSERNHQVSLMSTIYSRAFQVLVWLGTWPHEDVPILEMLNRRPDWDTLFPNNLTELDLQMDMETSSNHLFQVAHKLFKPSYWSRMWIVQEIVMARRIELHWGNTTARWADFHAFCELLNERILAIKKPVSAKLKTAARSTMAFQIARQRLSQRGGRCSLRAMMVICRRSRCRDPRDKIFSLLGIVKKETGGLQYFPDYGKGVLEVYEDVLLSRHQEILKNESRKSMVQISRGLIEYISYGYKDSPFDESIRHALSSGYTPKLLFRERGYSSSTIVSVGPTVEQLMQNCEPHTLSTWLSTIEHELLYETSFRKSAHLKAWDLLTAVWLNDPEKPHQRAKYRKLVQPVVSEHACATSLLNDTVRLFADDEPQVTLDLDAARTETCLFVTDSGDVGMACFGVKKFDRICELIGDGKDPNYVQFTVRFDDEERFGRLVSRVLLDTGTKGCKEHVEKCQQKEDVYMDLEFFLDPLTLCILTK